MHADPACLCWGAQNGDGRGDAVGTVRYAVTMGAAAAPSTTLPGGVAVPDFVTSLPSLQGGGTQPIDMPRGQTYLPCGHFSSETRMAAITSSQRRPETESRPVPLWGLSPPL